MDRLNKVTDLICYLTSGNANIGMSAILIRMETVGSIPTTTTIFIN